MYIVSHVPRRSLSNRPTDFTSNFEARQRESVSLPPRATATSTATATATATSSATSSSTATYSYFLRHALDLGVLFVRSGSVIVHRRVDALRGVRSHTHSSSNSTFAALGVRITFAVVVMDYYPYPYILGGRALKACGAAGFPYQAVARVHTRSHWPSLVASPPLFGRILLWISRADLPCSPLLGFSARALRRCFHLAPILLAVACGLAPSPAHIALLSSQSPQAISFWSPPRGGNKAQFVGILARSKGEQRAESLAREA